MTSYFHQSIPTNIGANVPRLARRSPKPLGWVRFPTVPAIFLGVAQLAERVAWDHEAVRAGLTTQTIEVEYEKGNSYYLRIISLQRHSFLPKPERFCNLIKKVMFLA